MSVHPFLNLERTDRAEWVFDFAGNHKAAPRTGGPAFPALERGVSPTDWLIAQFQRAAADAGLRDRLRTTVVEVVGGLGRAVASQERNQALGALLQVAAKFDFTELAPDLADWTRKNWLAEDHKYQLDGAEMPLRRTVWELLLAWKKLDTLELGAQLRRDLVALIETNEPGTAQLCFVALGERYPADALEMIPYTVPLWHKTYWTSTVHKFLSAHGPVELLRHVYQRAWAKCLAKCFYDLPFVDRHLRDPRLSAEFDSNRPNRLFVLLQDVGIAVQQRKKSVTLSSPRCTPLHVYLDVEQPLRQIIQSTMMPAQRSPSLYRESS
jgi:hypothetical protein